MANSSLCRIRPVLNVVLAFLAVASTACAGNAGSLFSEGFERIDGQGRIIGWREIAEGKTESIGVVRSDVTRPRGGERSVMMAHDRAARTCLESETVQLKVGRPYRLSGWIRTRAAVSDQLARYPTALPVCLTMESFPFTNHSSVVGGDSDWTRVESRFIATRSMDRIRLHLGYNGSATGSAWFDDVTLEEIDDIREVVPMETLRWHKDGYRFDDRGWIFVHIEGAPYERGYQYGTLLADEIVQYISKLAIMRNAADPGAGWKSLRFETDALFLRGYDEEFLTEMKGIADGAAGAKAKYDGRAIDLLDIVTINSSVDLDQMAGALEVTPHALSGRNFLSAEEELQIPDQKHKCSAFAATGPATAGGQVVFGQIFMWAGYTGVHWNVICDIAPAEGHRLVYQTFPGGIHSGADFYINSAGILIGETTVIQTPYEWKSTPQANRIRKAAQYASSIDDVERILWEGNNGLYTNDWPIADIKTGEVAILLLGTHRKKLWRTGENMDPFGTPGFLWSNNNNRDDEVRKEYVAHPDGRPFDLPFAPWNRDISFVEHYQDFKGKLDSNSAVRMWASSPINRPHACDGKITTTEMAREMCFLAHYGKVTLREKFPLKDQRIMPDLPGAIPHLSLGYSVASPVYLTDRLKEARESGLWKEMDEPKDLKLETGDLSEEFEIQRRKLWRGTVFPASPAENWFVSASAAYWKLLFDLESAGGKDASDKPVPAEKLAHELNGLARRLYYTLSREKDLAAVAGSRSYDQYGPYQIPRIKGTFAIHQLRLAMRNAKFLDFMRQLHERFSGQEMSNEQFLAELRVSAGESAAALVEQWIRREGLPQVRPEISAESRDGKWEVRLKLIQSGEPYRLFSHLLVDVGEERLVRAIEFEGPEKEILLSFDSEPTRIEFNPWSDFPAINANYYVWQNIFDDFHEMVMVYGTARQEEANHTLARRWQETIANAFTEILVPLIKDAELSEAVAAQHDLMVIGSLNDNRWFGIVEEKMPVRFGHNHFEWQGGVYGDPEDGLMLVLPNPLNPKRVMYVIAANSALQLHQMTKQYQREIPSWAIFKSDKIVKKGYHLPAGHDWKSKPRTD